jgi:DNA-directed RNA polymerase subunit K/omega
MPPKKLILKKDKVVTDTTITTKPKLNIIKSKKTIVEPIIETKVEPIEEQEEQEEQEDQEEQEEQEDQEDQEEQEEQEKQEDQEEQEDQEDQEDQEKQEEQEEQEEQEDQEDQEEQLEIIKKEEEPKPIEKQKNIKNKGDTLIKKEKEKENMNTINNGDVKIHNHSKPKTITASTKDVNTVDMFGNDDLDFRYVMMNYDYTKNVTMPKITKYERALLIGKRAKQIEEGANPNVKYISGQSVISIAEEELRQRKIPLIIKRPIGNKFEYWKPADMEVVMD